MKTIANLYYGNPIPATAPVVDDPFKMESFHLALVCLRHMSKQAGGFYEHMATRVSVARHPDGYVFIHGNGWNVSFQTDEYLQLVREANKSAGTEAIIAMCAQMTDVAIDADELIRRRFSLQSEGERA